MQFAGEEGDRYINKLKALMNENKLFTNPDLKLALLSREVGLTPHQLSKLINEKFAKSFNDYVNEHRVNEFILRVNDSKYQSFTIYGIALDVGFNSKSSFNTAFKKITGKTPSDYKIISTDRNVI
jgi:AraC-like DNA-binding protein